MNQIAVFYMWRIFSNFLRRGIQTEKVVDCFADCAVERGSEANTPMKEKNSRYTAIRLKRGRFLL